MIMPSREELKKIREYIMFHFLLRVIERDKEIISRVPLKFKQTYIELFEYVSNQAFREMVAAYDEIKAMKVKIYEQQRDVEGLRIRFLWRGYQNDTYYRWVDMVEDIKHKLVSYFNIEQTETR